jgi:hypothetical protein
VPGSFLRHLKREFFVRELSLDFFSLVTDNQHPVEDTGGVARVQYPPSER